MIGKNCKCFCIEDLSLIENYDKAINDSTQIWDCHHRLEIDLNLSREQMKERGLYYDRPANELIFLTHEDHQRMHKLHKNYMRGRYGELSPNYGKHPTDKTKELLRIKAKEQWSNPDFVKMIKEQKKCTNQGEENPAFGRTWMNNGINRAYPKPEEINYYLEKGYNFGYKLKDL